ELLQAVNVDPLTGEFTFEGLGPGTYELQLISVDGIGEIQSVVLGEGENLSGIELSVSAGRTITGQVTDSSSGQGLAHIPVVLIGRTGAAVETTTDSEGNYQVGRLGLGLYSVVVRTGGAAGRMDVDVVALDGDPITVDLQIETAGQIQGLLQSAT